MSDFEQKRVDYINNWPNSELFEAEKNYLFRVSNFVERYGETPFMPMKIWNNSDKDYHKFISKMIDSLEMMPLHPNHAFSLLFAGFDDFSKRKTGEEKITIRLKNIVDDFAALASLDTSVQSILTDLFTSIPMSASLYFYKRESLEGKVLKRITEDANNAPTPRLALINSINTKYGYDSKHPEVIRKAGALIRILFKNNNVSVNSTMYRINDNDRLVFLLLGILYTLRNDSMHGSSISATKSSKTTPERYALNYYAFLAIYTISMILLINKDDASLQAARYVELKEVTARNLTNMKTLFGNHIDG